MKKPFYKLFSKAERALTMKDLSALCRRRLILSLLIALPLVFAVAFPLLFLFVSAMVSPESSGVEQFKNLLDNIPQGTDERAQMFYIFTAFISPMLFMLAGWVSSFVFTLIIYTLTVSFGDIGKALAVVFLVIQIAGAGGTFPVEVVPEFFQGVYPFLPFTYGINAMREAVAGPYGADYWFDLLKLLAFVPFALVLGLLLRRPLIRFNEFFEKRIEDTHLM